MLISFRNETQHIFCENCKEPYFITFAIILPIALSLINGKTQLKSINILAKIQCRISPIKYNFKCIALSLINGKIQLKSINIIAKICHISPIKYNNFKCSLQWNGRTKAICKIKSIILIELKKQINLRHCQDPCKC